MRTILLTIIFSIVISSSKGQHIVQIKGSGGQVYTLSGDSTKHSFKATMAFYEENYVKAAEEKLLSVEGRETDDLGTAYYDVGCYYSLANKNELAFKYLIKSFSVGFDDVAHSLFDNDLMNLRKGGNWDIRMKPYIELYFKENSREIAMMYGEDQAARLSGNVDWKKLEKQDSARRIKVLKLIEDSKIKTAHDYYKAAMIMHHGSSPEDNRKAHELALMSLMFEKKHKMAPWLAAATKDRYLINSGKKQWFGTQDLQFLQETSKLGLNPSKIDTLAVTNEIRALWNAPSIEKLREYLQNWEEARGN